jgi:hypothetical protein
VPTTIDALVALPHVERPEELRRIEPVEVTTYELRDVTLKSFQRAPDGDVHMVLADEHGHTMIAEAAPPFCTDDSSPWKAKISEARAVRGPRDPDDHDGLDLADDLARRARLLRHAARAVRCRAERHRDSPRHGHLLRSRLRASSAAVTYIHLPKWGRADDFFVPDHEFAVGVSLIG